jgi:hypothetical protein
MMDWIRRTGVDAALVVLLGLTLALTVRLGIGVVTTAGDQVDARHYVAAGMTLAREGVFGYGAGEPNMYREPLTSWTIALQAHLDPRLRGLSSVDVDREGPAARAVKQQNLVWAALTLLGVGQLTLILLGSRRRREVIVALVAMLVTHVAFLEWEDVMDRSLSELAAAAILVWSAIAAVRAVDRSRPRDWLIVGAMLGLLALTKASFLYVAFVFLPLLALLRLWRRHARRRTLLRDLAIALVGLALVVTPWMGRNLQQFGTFGISDRGGLAIWFRVTWNDATKEELRGAWVYFAPLPTQPTLARMLGVDLEDFQGDGALRRVARFAPEDEIERRSFYRLARRDRGTLTDAYRAEGLPEWQAAHQADRDLMSAGVEALRSEPMRFVRTFPVFLWRGTWSMLYSNLVPSVLLGPLNLGGMALLMVALALSVALGRPRWFATVGVAGGIIIFYALLSHFEPRQARPAAPIMLMLCVLAADAALRAVADRRRRSRVSATRRD